jgi:branched-chain amino acid transport system permease protein
MMTILLSGLVTGAIYAIVALGFNIVLATSGVFNFAAPQFVLVGAMVAYSGLVVHGWPFVAVVVVATVLGAALGLLEERLAIRPLTDVGGHGALVTTVGVATVIEGVVLLKYGTDPRVVPFPWDNRVLAILNGRVTLVSVLIVALAVLLYLMLHFASTRTRWGLTGRATTSDREVTTLRGVDVDAVRASGFAVQGGMLAGAGTLIVINTTATFDLGNNLVILGFVALTLGGIGSYSGCVVGGLITGLVQQISARYLPVEYSLIILYVLLLGTLLVKPTGLLGKGRLRSV